MMKFDSGGNSGIFGLLTPVILIDNSIVSSNVSWLLSTDADNIISAAKTIFVDTKHIIKKIVNKFFLDCLKEILCMKGLTSRYLDS